MGFIFNDRRQQKLIGYCLSDFITKNDKSHMVVDIVSNVKKIIMNILSARDWYPYVIITTARVMEKYISV